MVERKILRFIHGCQLYWRQEKYTRYKLWWRERYYVLFMVDSCMGDKRNTQDINCGGLRKDTKFYSWLTVVWETKEIHKI